MSSVSWAAKAHPTSLTMINNGTYRDGKAGGQYNVGNIRGWGAAPSYQWQQFCASCPAPTVNRAPVRDAYRSTVSVGCCTAESYTPRVWNWGYIPLTENNTAQYTKLENRVLQRELWSHPFPYSWPTINDN